MAANLKRISHDHPSIAATAIMLEAGLGMAALALGAIMRSSVLATLHWNLRALLLGCVAAVPMLSLFIACASATSGPLADIRRKLDELLAGLFDAASTLDLLVISVAAGVGEELFFRAFLQGELTTAVGPWLGLGAASVLFGLAHPITRLYVVLAIAMGCYLGWIWMASGNLVVPIIAHGLYDFIVLASLARRREHEAEDLED